jgi:hypothetical protein
VSPGVPAIRGFFVPPRASGKPVKRRSPASKSDPAPRVEKP